MWQLSGSVFLGWSLGANDAANVFGTAVSARMIPYRTAVLTASLFILVGAWHSGAEGLRTYSGLQAQDLNTAFITSAAAAMAVTWMTFWRIPVSTSHAVVGGIIGVGLGRWIMGDPFTFNFGILVKIIICWVGTPIGAALCAAVLYLVIGGLFRLWRPGLMARDVMIRFLLFIAGAYGAYALGANNLANVTGPYLGRGMLSNEQAIWLGSLSIVFGVLTFSRNVMYTVGRDLVPLEPFTALIAIMAEAVTVHFYALIGVPVSTSQAIVGAVLGIGIIKGVRTIRMRTMARIAAGWVITPLSSCAFAAVMMLFCCWITGG